MNKSLRFMFQSCISKNEVSAALGPWERLRLDLAAFLSKKANFL